MCEYVQWKYAKNTGKCPPINKIVVLLRYHISGHLFRLFCCTTIIRLLIDLWPWKPFQQRPCTCWLLVPIFIEMHRVKYRDIASRGIAVNGRRPHGRITGEHDAPAYCCWLMYKNEELANIAARSCAEDASVERLIWHSVNSSCWFIWTAPTATNAGHGLRGHLWNTELPCHRRSGSAR